MRVTVNSTSLYILLNGIKASDTVCLGEGVEILAADMSHLDFNMAISASNNSWDMSVILAFVPLITAQFRITGQDLEETAATAWSSGWDAHLLSAIFHTEVGFNLQSDCEASAVSSTSTLRAIHHHYDGAIPRKPYEISAEDAEWLEANFIDARDLLEQDAFQTAVHCLASYRRHKLPRIQMAVLWAGIEGLFMVSTEVRFRISLYIARYLCPVDEEKRGQVFDDVKRLYNVRSAAVHGSKLKEQTRDAVQESAVILQSLIRKCIEENSLPDTNTLAP